MTTSITVRRIAQTRRELTAAAARLFIERGYEATTVEDIAAAAGISPRTFFRYLTAKEEVIDDVLEESIALFAAALDARPPGEPLLDSLCAAGHDSLNRAVDQGAVELFAVVRRTPALRARWLTRCNTYTDLIANSLRGRLDETENPVVADLGAGALIGMMTTVVDHFADTSSEQLAEILDASFARFVHGFASRT
ncbi:MAG: TetR family transcriptional regulator [Acidimicrobiales bacterium]